MIPFLRKSKDKLFFEEKILKCVNHASIPKIIDTIKDNKIYDYGLEYKSGKTIEEIIFGDRHKFTCTEIYKTGIKIIQRWVEFSKKVIKNEGEL